MEHIFLKELIEDILELHNCNDILKNNLMMKNEDKSKIFSLLLERVSSKAAVIHGMCCTKGKDKGIV